jgi:hypothetical protein
MYFNEAYRPENYGSILLVIQIYFIRIFLNNKNKHLKKLKFNS